MEKSDLEQLIGLLQERLEVIGNSELRENDPERHLAELQRVSEAIMAFHQTHKSAMPNRLNHFLENCSFDKALAWAQEASAE